MTKAADQPLLTDDPDVLGFVSARSYSSSVTSGWGRRRRRMQPARHMPLYGAGGGAALVSSRVGTARSSAASGGGGSALVVHSSRSMRAKMKRIRASMQSRGEIRADSSKLTKKK